MSLLLQTKASSSPPGGSVIRRAGKFYKARSRLYRSQILQVNTKYSLESSRRDPHNALLCTALKSYFRSSCPLRRAWSKQSSDNGSILAASDSNIAIDNIVEASNALLQLSPDPRLIVRYFLSRATSSCTKACATSSDRTLQGNSNPISAIRHRFSIDSKS